MADVIGSVDVVVRPDTSGFAKRARDGIERQFNKKNALKLEFEADPDDLLSDVRDAHMIAQKWLDQDKNKLKAHMGLSWRKSDIMSDLRRFRDEVETMADLYRPEVEADFKVNRKGLDKALDGHKAQLELDDKDLQRQVTRVVDNVSVKGSKQAAKNFDRALKSEKYGIDVDMRVDRKGLLKDMDTIREVLKNTADTKKQIEGFKFAVDVDQASVDRWNKDLEEAQGNLEESVNLQKSLSTSFANLGKNAQKFEKAISASKAEMSELGKDVLKDTKRIVELESELAALRKEMAESDEESAASKAREKRLLDQISAVRLKQGMKSIEMNTKEVKLREQILDLEKKISVVNAARNEIDSRQSGLEQKIIDGKALEADLKEKWERATASLEHASVELDVALDSVSAEAVRARIAEIARTRVVNLWVRATKLPDLEGFWGKAKSGADQATASAGKYMYQLTGLRLLAKSGQEFVELLPKLDMMIPQFAQQVALIGLASGGAVGGVASLFNIIADSAKVIQLGLAVPAALAAVGSTGFVLVQAFGDMKNHLPEVTEQFKNLKAQVSDGFWDTGAAPIGKMFDQIFGVTDKFATDFSRKVGEATGNLAKGFGDVFEKMGPRFFTNMNGMLDKMGPGLRSLGDAIGVLVAAGSDSFVAFGESFSQTMGKFDAWVNKNDANGNITRWIQEGADALGDLLSIAGDAVGIFAELANAFDAAGFPGLSEFADVVGVIRDSMRGLSEDEVFMQPLQQVRAFFDDLATVGPAAGKALESAWLLFGHSIETLSKPLAGALTGIFEGFSSETFQSGFGSFISGISSFIKDVTPGLEDFVSEFGSLLGVVGDAATAWGPAFNDLLLLMGSAGSNLHPGITSFLESTGPMLKAFVEDLKPSVEAAATAISDLLGNEDFQKFVSDVVGSLGDMLEFIVDLVPHITAFAEGLAEWYGDQPAWLQKLVSGVTAFVIALPLLGGVLAAIAKPFKVFLTGIKGIGKVITGAWNVLKWFGSKLGTLFNPKGGGKGGPLGGITRLFDGIRLKFMYFGDWLKALPGRFAGWIGNLWSTLGSKFTSGISTLGSKISGAWTTVTNALSTFGSKISGALSTAKGAIGRAFSPLANLARSIGGTIAKDFGTIGNALKGLPSTIGGALKSLPSKLGSMFKGLGGFFKNLPSTIGKYLPKAGQIFSKLGGILGGLFKGAGLKTILGGVLKKALGFLTGPAGWIALIADLIYPVQILDFVGWILDAVGLGDSWFADLTESLSNSIERVMGSGSLLDMLLKPFKDAFAEFKEGNIKDGILTLLGGSTFSLVDILTNVVGEMMGLDEGKIGKVREMMGLDGSISDFFSQTWENIKKFASDGWDYLMDKLDSWIPGDGFGGFFSWLWDKIKEAFGFGGGGKVTASAAAGPSSMSAQSLGIDTGFFEGIGEKITGWLSDGWNTLVGWVTGWAPIQGAINMVSKIWGFIKNLFADSDGDGKMNLLDGDFWSGIWTSVSTWITTKWDELKTNITNWKPVATVLNFVEKVWTWVKTLLGIAGGDADKDGKANVLDADWWSGFWDNKIKPWFSDKWEELKTNITEWKPVATVLNLAEKVWAWVKTLLGLAGGDADKDGTINILDGDWWGGAWTSVKTWFSDKWEELKTNVTEWKPVATVIDLASKVIDWVKDLLGLGEGGFTGTFDFDFTDLWNDKIKPALKNGLIALGALILAPAAIVLAPVLVPAAIIGWLLGKDGEGNWSFQELTDKISGAWDKIKGGIEEGIGKIGGFIDTLVITPIEVGEKIKGWVFGDKPFEGLRDNVSNFLSGASGPLSEGVNAALESIKANVPGAAQAGGVVSKILGLDEPGKAHITGGLSTTKDNFNVFGLDLTKVANGARTGVSGEFEGMKNETSGSLGGMSTDGSAKMEALRASIADKMARAKQAAKENAQEARDAVVNRMQNMKVDGSNNVEGLRSAVQNKTSDMSTKGGSNIESLRSAVVKKLTDMKKGGGDQFEGLRSTASSKGQSTRNDYVDKMQSLNTDSAKRLRDFADAAKKILAIDATKAGTSTGSTYKGGLGNALTSAKTLASSMADGVKSNLKVDAYSSGSSIGSTFVKGLRSKVNAVSSAASALVSAARSKMPNSPAKEGPFSGSGWGGWGESIADELAAGLKKGAPAVAKEAEKMMGGVATRLDATTEISAKPDVKGIRDALNVGAAQASGGDTIIQVNVESKADDPLTEGARFASDMNFALKGAGI